MFGINNINMELYAQTNCPENTSAKLELAYGISREENVRLSIRTGINLTTGEGNISNESVLQDPYPGKPKKAYLVLTNLQTNEEQFYWLESEGCNFTLKLAYGVRGAIITRSISEVLAEDDTVIFNNSTFKEDPAPYKRKMGFIVKVI